MDPGSEGGPWDKEGEDEYGYRDHGPVGGRVRVVGDEMVQTM